VVEWNNAAQAYVHGDFATFHTDTFHMGANGPSGDDFSPEVKEQQSAADEAFNGFRSAVYAMVQQFADFWHQLCWTAPAHHHRCADRPHGGCFTTRN